MDPGDRFFLAVTGISHRTGGIRIPEEKQSLRLEQLYEARRWVLK